jgi:glycosyltransferase involved in cell wall biosynthesis
MRKVLFVTGDLEYSGAAAQLALLALGVPRGEIEPTVCVLGDEGPLAPALRAASVRVEALGRRRGLDVRPLLRLRRLLAELRPDVVHAWKPRAVRALALAAGRGSRPLLVSHGLPVARARGPVPGRLDRWLLRRADCVLAAGPAEADRWRRVGLSEVKVRVVPPGVRPAAPERAPLLAPRPGTSGPYLLCVGPLEAHKGHRDAIWAFDVLRRLYPDLRLLLAGSGPERPRLERFVASIRLGEIVHFVGAQEDLTGLLAQAEAVWVPSLADGGVHVALEAMAAGRPVVATHLPGLAEVVADGETGFLVPPGDKVNLARRTRLLLDDEARRRGMGEAGRRRAGRHFAAEAFVGGVAGLYRELAN